MNSFRAVPFKSVGGGEEEKFFEGGRGRILNYFIPDRLYMISGRSSGMSNL